MKSLRIFSCVVLVGMALTQDIRGVNQSSMMVFLPDTQNYVEWKRSGVSGQIDWILSNQVASNIVFVGHVGDIVNDYDTNPDQWAFMQQEMNRLSASNLPFSVCPGNHDYQRGSRDSRMLNEDFPLDTFTAMPTYGGAYDNLCDNTYHVVRVQDQDWLLLSLEFGPRDAVLTWANEVLKTHRDLPAIVVTHAYLSKQGERFERGVSHAASNGYGLGQDVNDGVDIWNELVYSNSQVRLVVCGHDGAADVGAKVKQSTNVDGYTVCEVLTNYQYFKTPAHSGYMLILDFSSDGQASFRTFSPLLNKDFDGEGAHGVLDLSGL